MAEETIATLLEEATDESETSVGVTFDKDVTVDRRTTSVDSLCESGALSEHDAELAMALEVEGTIRLIEDGEVREIAVLRESLIDKTSCSKELLMLQSLAWLKLVEAPTTE
jgi:hypothetical protein